MKSSVLSVDVEAAIRKLTESQLSRPELRSVELIRLLFQAGAGRLDIQLRRDSLRVGAPDTSIRPGVLHALAGSVDPSRSAEERYRSVLDLEELDGLTWLALTTGQGLRLTAQLRSARIDLNIFKGRLSFKRISVEGRPHVTVVLRRRARVKDERETLRHYTQYSRRVVTVNGEDVRASRPDPNHQIVRRVGGVGFEGHVRLLAGDGYSCIRWIRHEVLDAERFSQSAGGVVHEASVYCCAGADVRQRAVVAVRDTRESTVASLKHEFVRLFGPARDAARSVMFARAIGRCDPGVLGEAPVFQTLAGEHLSAKALVGRASRGPLEVCSVDQSRGVSNTAVVLDSQGRQLVTGLLGLPIAQNPVSPTRTRVRQVIERLAETLWELSETCRELCTRLRLGAPVSEDRLSEQERTFVVAVRTLLADGRFRIPNLEPEASRRAVIHVVAHGRLPVRVSNGPLCRVSLPRSSAALQRTIAAFDQDPAFIYPALDLIFGGRDGWGSRRAQWRRQFLGSVSLRPPALDSNSFESPNSGQIDGFDR